LRPSPSTTTGTSARRDAAGRSRRTRARRARGACCTRSTTTSLASASRSGRCGRHALAHAGGDAALEGEHLLALHRRLADRAQIVVAGDDERLVPRPQLRVRVADELREDVPALPDERDRVRIDDNPEGG